MASAWRQTVGTDKKVALSGSTTGVAFASLWKMHNVLPFSLFANCGGQVLIDCHECFVFFFPLVSHQSQAVVFDVSSESVVRSFEQPFVAASADLLGPMVCLGVDGGVQVARVDWNESTSTPSWQSLSLDGGAAGPRRAVVRSKKKNSLLVVRIVCRKLLHVLLGNAVLLPRKITFFMCGIMLVLRLSFLLPLGVSVCAPQLRPWIRRVICVCLAQHEAVCS